MKQPHLSQDVALNHAFQEALPLCQASHALRMTKLPHCVVIGRILKSRYRWSLHHANFSRLKLVFLRGVTPSVIKQLLVSQPYVQALASSFISLDDNIQGGCYCDQQAADCSDGRLVNEDAKKCSAPSQQVYELESVSHSMEQPFLEQKVANGVLGFGFSFVRNVCLLASGTCIHENSSLSAAVIIPIIRIVVVIREVWWLLWL